MNSSNVAPAVFTRQVEDPQENSVEPSPRAERDRMQRLPTERDGEGNAYPQTRHFEPNNPNSSRLEKPATDSPDWFERQTGKPRPSTKVPGTDLPLFAGERQ